MLIFEVRKIQNYPGIAIGKAFSVILLNILHKVTQIIK